MDLLDAESFKTRLTTNTFRVFLGTLTASQRTALLDVLCSHVENVQVDCEQAPSEFAFIVDLSETIASVSTSAACGGMWTL